jgi:hypothetical protein
MEQSEAVAHQAAAVQAAKASAPTTSTDATSPHAATILTASATAAMDAAVAAQERLSQELQAAEARTAVVAAALQAVVQELDVQVACCRQGLADLEDSRRQNIAAGGKAAEATSRAEAADTRLQNVRLQLKSMSGGKAMQRTLSGGLVSGLSSVSAIYKALGPTHNSDGSRISAELSQASFKKPIVELGERRLRTLINSMEKPIEAVLGAYHEDKAGLQVLLAASHWFAGKSTNNGFKMARAAELPIVRDAVQSYNQATSAEERETILSTLTNTFDRQSLDQLGFDNVVSKQSFTRAQAHVAAYGPGRRTWERTLHITHINAALYDAALEVIHCPEFMQEVAFGKRDLELADGNVIPIPDVHRKVCTPCCWFGCDPPTNACLQTIVIMYAVPSILVNGSY